MRNNKIYILVFVLFISTQGCSHFIVTVPESDPATDYESKTMHSLFWGLINNPQKEIVTDCVTSAIDEVRVSTNFGYSLITVATLGIWTPIDVEWRCSKPKQNDDGSL